MLKLLKPLQDNGTYEPVCEAFVRMYQQVTQKRIPVLTQDDGISDLAVIGSDAVQDFVQQELLENRIDSLQIRYGTDDYTVFSYKKDGRRILVLAGGRVRSSLYAVYDYFETCVGCHYFWDGDIIPTVSDIPLDNIRILQKQSFAYRGLRYFAHRGLKRFQAEHWSFEDWQKELDWIVKKRLNFFMLRIGMDDLWQRAFPEIVPYPDTYRTVTGGDANGYDDRSDFWTLKYRGKLREKILDYANRLDLMHPVDCGTMTHWYARTPQEYLDTCHPPFLEQLEDRYIGTDTGKVWDFRVKKNMDDYMHLTDTCVKEFDKTTDLFHTIGIAERTVYADRKKNHDLKLFAYRRIAERIRETYPHSTLMIASWDFVGWWTGEEVQALLKELDPKRTVILDYTSDANDPDNSFLNWGMVGKFPYVFGIFHGYESDSELRGPYERTEERYRVACHDPCCQGMVFWPELSHSDPLILEYLCEKSWAPSEKPVEVIVSEFCKKRYGEKADFMNACWQNLLPFIKQNDWGGFTHRTPEDPLYKQYHSAREMYTDIWTRMFDYDIQMTNDPILFEFFEEKIQNALTVSDKVLAVLESLAKGEECYRNTFILRDSTDMVRTVLGRYLNYTAARSFVCTNKDKRAVLKTSFFELFEAMQAVLCVTTDFSLYHSLQDLQKTAPTNPQFEITLKHNIGNGYCAQACYETATYLYKDEARAVFDYLDGTFSQEQVKALRKRLYTQYEQTPLTDMQPQTVLAPEQAFEKARLAVQKAVSVLTKS